LQCSIDEFWLPRVVVGISSNMASHERFVRARITREWSPASWRSKKALQMADWEDNELAAKVLDKLLKLPPLVQRAETDHLKAMMAAAGRGEKFIIQGGDCAERFVDCNQDRLEKQLKLLLQMGMIIEHVTGKPPVCIARMAGQYGKPRSKPTEVVEGFGEIMSFKGENINGFAPTERKWDPERMLQGYWHSAATLNFMRGFLQSSTGGTVASDINMDLLKASTEFGDLNEKAQDIAARFSEQAAAPVFTAHEAMQLDLEEALTRPVADRFYNLSAHLVWIGDRTRQIDGAHVEYFRGIANPVGVKVGPSMKDDELQELLQILNPHKEEGKVMIITRYGAGKIEEILPGHIEAVKATGIPVVWQCDAVHGNGIVAKSNNYKTRHMDDIVSEIMKCIGIHKKCGTILGGVHLEMTGEETVTECLGGCVGLTEEMLTSNYETLCDPRLNYGQAVETAFKVAAAVN